MILRSLRRYLTYIYLMDALEGLRCLSAKSYMSILTSAACSMLGLRRFRLDYWLP